MSDAPESDRLAGEMRGLESVAALGYLLSAIAHDLNNQLTNLLLGADQLQYGGGADAAEMMVQQANRVAEVTRAVQRLGQMNFGGGRSPSDLGEVTRAFGEWRRRTGRGAGDSIETEDGLLTRADPLHFGRALAMLADAFSDGLRPVQVVVRTEQMPRTAWSREDDTVAKAVLRMQVGEPAAVELSSFKEVVDGFFDSARTDEEVRLMAAWEIIRKQRGRMSVYGEKDSRDREIVISFPLVEP